MCSSALHSSHSTSCWRREHALFCQIALPHFTILRGVSADGVIDRVFSSPLSLVSCIDKEAGLLLLNPFLFLLFNTSSFISTSNTSSNNSSNNSTSSSNTSNNAFTSSLTSSLNPDWLQDQTDQLRGERSPRQ